MDLNSKCVKIGDEVELYLTDGYVTSRKSESDATIKAILIGYSKEFDEFMFGWKGNETKPKDAYMRTENNRRYGVPEFKYLEDHGDFLYGFRINISGYRWEIANVKKDLNNWRHWRTERKGECPCGGNYGVCTYHPLNAS